MRRSLQRLTDPTDSGNRLAWQQPLSLVVHAAVGRRSLLEATSSGVGGWSTHRRSATHSWPSSWWCSWSWWSKLSACWSGAWPAGKWILCWTSLFESPHRRLISGSGRSLLNTCVCDEASWLLDEETFSVHVAEHGICVCSRTSSAVHGLEHSCTSSTDRDG